MVKVNASPPPPPPEEDLHVDMSEGGVTEDDLLEMHVDLSGTREATFEPIPSGLYESIVDEIGPTTSKPSDESPGGKPMLRVVYEITEEVYRGRKQFQNWMLTEQGLPYLKRYLNAFGYDTTKPISVRDICVALLGAPCRIKVRQRIYQGETVNNVTDLLPSKAGGASGVTGGDSELPV